jgi:hypothetical protein
MSKGTENILDKLSGSLGKDICQMMGGIPMAKLRHTIKTEIHKGLTKVKTKCMIFGMLLAEGKVVTMMQMKSAPIHPGGTFLLIPYLVCPQQLTLLSKMLI